MNPTEPASSGRLRQITWRIWLAWVLVCALAPVFSTMSATAFGKQISPNAEYKPLITAGLLALIVLGVLAPPLMQGLVLKRVMPKLRLWTWFFCIVLSGIVWLALMFGWDGHGPSLIKAGFQTQFELRRAARALYPGGTPNAAHLLVLPWAPFLLWTIATSALTSLAPACALGMASRLWRATLLFLVAAIVAACASAVVEQIYQMTVDYRAFGRWELNGLPWTQRFQIVALRAGVGAVWGATAAMVVILMTRGLAAAKAPNVGTFATHRGLAWVLIAPLLIAVSAPFAGYLAGPRGLVAGAPELRKAMSPAPWGDRSQGETVLAYSHDVALAAARISAPVIAPDGASAIVRTADHTLVQVDIASGRALRTLAGALAPLERHAIVWSPDGRYLALRSNGAEMPVPKSHYRQHQSRVRLYALPDLTLAGEFSSNDGTCFDVYAREPMLFSHDGRSLWLVCGQHAAPKPEDVMAIRLDVPAMQVLDIRVYGEGADSGRIGGLERIGESVWAWQSTSGGKPFRIRDLTQDRDIAKVPMPADLIGKLTEQTGQSKVNEKTIRLNFCGQPPGALTDGGPASWICRTLTFDTQTAGLIGSVDKGDHRVLGRSVISPRGMLSAHGMRVEAFWQDDSKTGELVVRDGATGRERQRIVSIAQRPVQMSADGRWLMTVAVGGGGLRLYRIQL